MSLTDANNADFTNISESNLNRIHNTVSKVGYSDGITDGRESVFQKGFDKGYEAGLFTGFELAKLRSFFEVVSKNPTSDEFRAESTRYKDLEIVEPKNKTHFKLPEQTGNTIEEAYKQQMEYVNQHKGVFAKELPIVSNLFSQ